MDKQTQQELQSIVRNNYDEIAGQYNETRMKHLEPLWTHLVDMIDRIPAGARVLDVGCGNGRLLEAFGKKDIVYLGVDQNENLLSFARKKYPDRDFVRGDILDLGKLKEIGFDFIFGVALLHHLPGKDTRIRALRQVRNKLKTGGTAVFTVWNLWTQKKYRHKIYRYFFLKLAGKNKMDQGDILFAWKNSRGDKVSQRYYHAFTRGELRRLGQRSGFNNSDIFTDRFNYYLSLKK